MRHLKVYPTLERLQEHVENVMNYSKNNRMQILEQHSSKQTSSMEADNLMDLMKQQVGA